MIIKLHKKMINKRQKSYAKIQGHADLLNWIGTGEMTGDKETKEHNNSDTAKYNAALQFFLDIEKDYSIEKIKEINLQLAKKNEVDLKVILEVMSQILEEDIEKRIHKY